MRTSIRNCNDTDRIGLGQVRTFEPHQGRTTVTVLDGVVWITPGDGQDIILEPGESIVFDGPSVAVLSPLRSAATICSVWSDDQQQAA